MLTRPMSMVSSYQISLSLLNARHSQPYPAQLLHVPYTREGYQAGDSGSEGVACAWVQVPSAGQGIAGEAGHRAAEVWGGDNGERVLLAWTQGMQVCDQTQVEF